MNEELAKLVKEYGLTTVLASLTHIWRSMPPDPPGDRDARELRLQEAKAIDQLAQDIEIGHSNITNLDVDQELEGN